MDSRARSPLERSQAGGLTLLSFLLGLLGVITAGATILIWTIDEQDHALGRGFLMLGLSTVFSALSALLFWLRRRPPSSSREGVDRGPHGVWHRRRLGPAWTDWASLGIPPIIIGIPLLLLIPRPLEIEAVLGTALVVGLLQLLILLQLIIGRRERVGLDLAPEGLVVTFRNGRRRLLRRGEVHAVRLNVARIRGFEFGTLELHVIDGMPLVFREPMSAPLPDIAHYAATHMGLPVQHATEA